MLMESKEYIPNIICLMISIFKTLSITYFVTLEEKTVIPKINLLDRPLKTENTTF